MESTSRLSYSGQGARPKTSNNTSREVSSDDGNSQMSDSGVQDQRVEVQNGCVFLHKSQCLNPKLKPDIISESSKNTSPEVKGHGINDSGYEDVLGKDAKGNIGKKCQEVKVESAEGHQVMDSGFEEFELAGTGNGSQSDEMISEADVFRKELEEFCQNKHFDDHEKFLLSKWRESGLKLWKILHEREVHNNHKKSHKNLDKDNKLLLQRGELASDHDKENYLFQNLPCDDKIVAAEMISLKDLAVKKALGASRNSTPSRYKGESDANTSLNKCKDEEIGSDLIRNGFVCNMNLSGSSGRKNDRKRIESPNTALSSKEKILDPSETGTYNTVVELGNTGHCKGNTEGNQYNPVSLDDICTSQGIKVQQSVLNVKQTEDNLITDSEGNGDDLNLDITDKGYYTPPVYSKQEDSIDTLINDVDSWNNFDFYDSDCQDDDHCELQVFSTDTGENFQHIPFFCSGPVSCCNNKVWKVTDCKVGRMEPEKYRTGDVKKDKKMDTDLKWTVENQDRILSPGSDKSEICDTEKNLSVIGEGMKMPKCQNVKQEEIIGEDSINFVQNGYDFKYIDDESDTNDDSSSIDLEFNEVSRPRVHRSLKLEIPAQSLAGSSNSQSNFKDHLLKALDHHRSPMFSSDSAITDRSSANDWADESSDANIMRNEKNFAQCKRNSCPTSGYGQDSCMSKSCSRFSPKRFRKKSRSRSRSMDHEAIVNTVQNGSVLVGNENDSDSTERSFDGEIRSSLQKKDSCRPKACKANTSQLEISKSTSYLDTDSLDFTGNQSVDSSSSESSQSSGGNCYTGCGPATGLLGLRYAIPYLSERLKMSLAKRIEPGNAGNHSANKVKGQNQFSKVVVDDDGFSQSEEECTDNGFKVVSNSYQCKECQELNAEGGKDKDGSDSRKSSGNDDMQSYVWNTEGTDDKVEENMPSNKPIFTKDIPVVFPQPGPHYLGPNSLGIKNQYRVTQCGCSSFTGSNEDGSCDEISQSDGSEGLEISHSFQYIDISDEEVETDCQEQLKSAEVDDSISHFPKVNTLPETISEQDSSKADADNKSMQSSTGQTERLESAFGRSFVPLDRLQSSTVSNGTGEEQRTSAHLNYFSCVQLPESLNEISYRPCQHEISKSLDHIGYLPCVEINESMKHIGRGVDTENCSCAGTGFLSADGADLDDVDVEESRADIQFLSIEQDTSDCSSIRSDTDRSNLSEEMPVRSLFSTHSESDSGEADDEFECECDHCLQLRSRNHSTLRSRGQGQTHLSSGDVSAGSHGDDEVQGQPLSVAVEGHSRGSHNLDMWLPDGELEEGLYRISIAELSPLSNLMNSRRSELEVMFENVILQMLAVHPDLLSDATPPPADKAVRDGLPTLPVDQGHLAVSLSCPICLCLCEEKEILSCLPCQHLFHQLCIQAWLVKSGTCPVCRRIL